MGRKVEIDIIADAKGRGFESAAAGAELAAKGVDHLGDQMEQTKRRAESLDREIAKHALLVKALGAEYVETGDKDVFKNLRTERGEVRKLQTIRKEMGEVGQLAEQLTAEAGRVGPALEKAFSDLPFLPNSPQTALPIVAAIVASAPAIGAALTGAILAGLGTGVIAGGIVAQFTDPRVHDAGVGFATDLKNEIVSASSGIADPLIAGLGFLERDLEPVFADLRKDFQALRPYVSSLLDHIGQMAQHIMPGFNKAIERSGPVLEELGKDLVILGDGVSEFFDQLSKGSKGGVEGLRGISVFLATTIGYVGLLLRGLAAVADFGVQAMDKIESKASGFLKIAQFFSPLAAGIEAMSGPTHDLATSFDGAGLSADDFTGSLDQQGNALAQTKGMADIFDTSVDGVSLRTQALTASVQADITALGNWNNTFLAINGTAISVEQANEAMTNAIDALTEGVKANGTSLDVHTTKGAANRASVLASIQAANEAAQAAYDNAIANGRQSSAAQEAKNTYDGYIKKLTDAAHAAGFNDAQIRQMINDLGRVPKEVTTRVRTVFLTEGTPPGRYVPGQHIGERYGGVVHAAKGLLAGGGVADRPTISFAEPGLREMFLPDKGISRQRAYGLLRAGADWYGADVVPRGYRMAATPRTGGSGGASPVQVVLTGTDDLTRALVGHLQAYVVGRGGDVQVALGRDS